MTPRIGLFIFLTSFRNFLDSENWRCVSTTTTPFLLSIIHELTGAGGDGTYSYGFEETRILAIVLLLIEE